MIQLLMGMWLLDLFTAVLVNHLKGNLYYESLVGTKNAFDTC